MNRKELKLKRLDNNVNVSLHKHFCIVIVVVVVVVINIGDNAVVVHVCSSSTTIIK